ncbi:hypothetical protein RVR_4530 [Actinacidiphila reveromycinica]|uniref:Uncharacterized protein n=1 Tax=Actinacidiphila reveromycinica TaxID=659352 RepID=A0A7U3VP92_9ACTN|nr:hypothetical protein [Streptomyces sp. SN-593]BBA98374.1 hypothetical protein RVR_4530 [Streptomyces sp. SN-593]
MTPLPGQRAAQRPIRAMVASQRALGRAAQAANGALVGPTGVAFIDGQQYDVDLSAPPDEQLRPVEPPCVCTCRCPCPCAEPGAHDGGRTKKQKRQG